MFSFLKKLFGPGTDFKALKENGLIKELLTFLFPIGVKHSLTILIIDEYLLVEEESLTILSCCKE